MPDSITNKTRREMLSALRATRAALFHRRRSKEKQARRSNTHESSSSNFFDADAADGAMGRFLTDEEACEYKCEQNSRHGDDHNDDDSEEEDVLDVTRRGGDGPAVPTSIIMTYAPTPSTPMFLSYGVQPLAPPAVSTRRASMGAYYRPTYVSDAAITTGGRTMNRRGTVPPMGTAAAAVEVGGYLSSTVDSLVAGGDDPATCAAGLDIDTSNHHADHRHDQHHAAKTYTFRIDHPPSTNTKDGRHQDNNEEERRRKFEAKRKAEATRNPRFL